MKSKLLALALGAVIIYAGFGEETYTVDICKSTVSKYVTAEFSEAYMGVDFDGNVYTETDAWSEPVSEVYTETVVNDYPVYPPMPKHDTSASRESGFDNFNFHVDTRLTIGAYNDSERTYFTESIVKAPNCLQMLDTEVVVNTWWTITYGSDFSGSNQQSGT